MPVYLLIGTCKKTVFQEYRVANDMHVKVIHADEVHTKSPKAEGFRQRVRYNVTVRFFLIYAKPCGVCGLHIRIKNVRCRSKYTELPDSYDNTYCFMNI